MPTIDIQTFVMQRTPTLSYQCSRVDIRLTSYELLGNSATVYYGIYEDLEGRLVSEGNLVIEADHINTWGLDDNVLIDAVLHQLGLERALAQPEQSV